MKHQAALDELFAQVLGVLSSEGLIRLERVMHDGTKVKALASVKSFRREARLREHLEQARERVRQMSDAPQEEVSTRQAQARQRAARERCERLEQALEEMQKVEAREPGRKPREQRRVSETDPEARIMKQPGGGYAPSHNVQISTDAAHRLIVGVSVTQSVNDQGQLPPALDEVERNLGRLPQQVVADAGFTTRETILKLAERQVDFIGGTVEAGKRSRPRPGIGPVPLCGIPQPLSMRPSTTSTPARREKSWGGGEPNGLGWGCCTTSTKRRRRTAEPVFFGRSVVREPRHVGSSAPRMCRRWQPL